MKRENLERVEESAAPPKPRRKSKHEYSDNQHPCLVAKLPCGHYCAAADIDIEDEEGIELLANDAKEFRGFGATLEIRPVSFVRSGGLTFNCRCERRTDASSPK